MKNGAPLIILGVTGSIAAYKSLDLIRRLDANGVSVRVVATEKALSFFPRLSAEVFSGAPVEIDLFASAPDPLTGRCTVRHLALLEGADLVLVAPASANFLARLSLGLADDLLSTLALAATCPILVAPAMEEAMYAHPASVLHRKTLASRHVSEISPESGALASGKTGLGRMANVERIVSEVLRRIGRSPSGGDLAGQTVLVSAGPTLEPLDAVRYLGNRSSGRMGYALAQAAADRGARVTLVSGPSALPPPSGVVLHRVETASQMEHLLAALFSDHRILIMNAAVSDYRPKDIASGKRKKNGHGWTLELVENPDILKNLAARKTPDQFLIGFAAESGLDPVKIREKLHAKGVDLLVANDISHPETGFGSTDNAVTILSPDGRVERVPLASKREIADSILDRIPKGTVPGVA